MTEMEYYGFLIIIALITFHFYRRGHLLLMLMALALGGWIIYSKQEKVSYRDVQQNLYKTIDEAAKSEYDEKIMNRTDQEDDNLSREQ